MKRRTEMQKLVLLKEVSDLIAQGASQSQACRHFNVSAASIGRWRTQYQNGSLGAATIQEGRVQ